MQKKRSITFYLLMSFFTLLSLGTIIGLSQLWFSVLEEQTFLKLLFTFAILLALNVIALIVAHQFLEEKRLKEGGFID